MNAFIASKNNDVDTLSYIFSDNDSLIYINERDDCTGLTALNYCATYGSIEAAIFLLNKGASLYCADYENGWNPLHRALYFGHFKLSLLLIKAGSKLGDENIPTGQDKLDLMYRKERNRSISNIKTWKKNIDHDGFSPIDLISEKLAKYLPHKSKKNYINNTSVFSFGKPDFTLGYALPNTIGDIIKPKLINDLANENVKQLASSKYHSMALTNDGKIYTWGHGRHGKLGHGNEMSIGVPLYVSFKEHFVTIISAAENHSMLVTKNGSIFTWGCDKYGQLGHNCSTGLSILVPKQIESLKSVIVVGIAAGDSHSICFTNKGELYGWGNNNKGQLGIKQSDLGSNNMLIYPKLIVIPNWSQKFKNKIKINQINNQSKTENICPILQVSASSFSTVVLCCASNRYYEGAPLTSYMNIPEINEVYQFGHGCFVPTRVIFGNKSNIDITSSLNSFQYITCSGNGRGGSGINIIQISAGKFHNVALSSSSYVYTWGFGDHISDDKNSYNYQPSYPQLVEALLPTNGGGKVINIAATNNRTAVISDVGDLYSWGSSQEKGVLGHGNESNYQPIPKRITGLKRVISVVLSECHTLCLTSSSLPRLPYEENYINPFNNDQRNKIENEYYSDEDNDENNCNYKHVNNKMDSKSTEIDEINICMNVLSLKEICVRELAKNIDLRNATSLLSIADQFYSTSLSNFCASFIKRNLDAILVQNKSSDLDILIQDLGDEVEELISNRKFSYDENINKNRSKNNTNQMKKNILIDTIILDNEKIKNQVSNEVIIDMSNSMSVMKRIKSISKKLLNINIKQTEINDIKSSAMDKIAIKERKEVLENELNSLSLVLERLNRESDLMELSKQLRKNQNNDAINELKNNSINDSKVKSNEILKINQNEDFNEKNKIENKKIGKKKFIPANNFLEHVTIIEKSNFTPSFKDWNKIHNDNSMKKEIESNNIQTRGKSFDEIVQEEFNNLNSISISSSIGIYGQTVLSPPLKSTPITRTTSTPNPINRVQSTIINNIDNNSTERKERSSSFSLESLIITPNKQTKKSTIITKSVNSIVKNIAWKDSEILNNNISYLNNEPIDLIKPIGLKDILKEEEITRKFSNLAKLKGNENPWYIERKARCDISDVIKKEEEEEEEKKRLKIVKLKEEEDEEKEIKWALQMVAEQLKREEILKKNKKNISQDKLKNNSSEVGDKKSKKSMYKVNNQKFKENSFEINKPSLSTLSNLSAKSAIFVPKNI